MSEPAGRRHRFWHGGFTVLPAWRQRPVLALTDEDGSPGHQVFTKLFWTVKLDDGTIAYLATESMAKTYIDKHLEGCKG